MRYQGKMNKILTIYPDKCTNCRSCELACSFHKTGKFNPRESAVNVLFCEEAAISVPIMCLQCEEPACMKVCPVKAISKDENAVVTSDPRKCIGCKLCVSACQMGNIAVSTVTKRIIKCDLCGGDPSCAKICPSGAIKYEDATISNVNKKRVLAEKFKDLFAEVNE